MQYFVLDVREPDEYLGGHVKGAINIPSSEMSSVNVRLSEIPKDLPIIVYCRSGKRASAAKDLMESIGFIDVTNGISQEQVEEKYEH